MSEEDDRLQELLDRWREQRIQQAVLSPYQQCEHFWEVPDDERPTQMWYPVQHGTSCKGHRVWLKWTDQMYHDVAPKFEPRHDMYIKLCDEWKDAL